MISALRSTRSGESPASIPRAGPAVTRISGVQWRWCRKNCARAARMRRHNARRISCPRSAWPGPIGMSRNSRPTVEGTLVWPPRGEQGFGYDPMFLPDGHARTFGEMPSQEKHGLPPAGPGLSLGLSHQASHRARAFLKLAEACLDAR